MADGVVRRDVLKAGTAGAVWLGGLPLATLLHSVPAVTAVGHLPAPGPLPQSTDDLAYLSIAQASQLIRARKLSPVDLLDACLHRIGRFEPKVSAWIRLLADDARAQAKASAARAAHRALLSPLDGIPIAIKDLYDQKSVRTTAGSKVLADAPPAAADSTVVARLRRAGSVLLGKVNTHEFAYGVWTPPTSNPWELSHIPGGSSGGSGAALSAGMCLGATGSDTGGSIRIPSSLCGTVGIKPTFGRVSKAGLIPLAWSLDHAGPMARTVEDCALLLNVIAGPDPQDPSTSPVLPPDFSAGIGRPVRGFRVGVPTSVFFDGAEAGTEAAVRAAVPVLQKLGVHVVPLTVPASQNVAATSYLIIQLSEPLAAHEYYLRRRPQDYQTQTQLFFGLDAEWAAQHYLRAQRIRTINIAQWVGVFGGVDAVLTPTTPRAAPTKQEAQATGVIDLVNYTSLFDLNGCPSISVPAGFSGGLPVGLMLSARPFDEVRLLQLAYAYQQATGFNARRPALS